MDVAAYSNLNSIKIQVFRKQELIYENDLEEYNRDQAMALKRDLQILETGDIVQLKNIMHQYLDDLSVVMDDISLEIIE